VNQAADLARAVAALLVLGQAAAFGRVLLAVDDARRGRAGAT
jgi:hypothetical protein